MQPRELFFAQGYRSIGIEISIFSAVLAEVAYIARYRRVFVVPSGAGAFLLTDLAARLGLDAASVSAVARSVLVAQCELVRSWFEELANMRCERVVDLSPPFPFTERAGVSIVYPSDRISSTDALWGAITLMARCQYGFNFKKLSFTGELAPDVQAKVGPVDLPWLRENARLWESIDASPLLDMQCLASLAHANAAVWIVDPAEPGDIRRILAQRTPTGRVKHIVLRSG
jgi:hypothetical protein